MIKLFVIEDHPVIVEGLQKMFHLSSEGFKISGHSSSVDEFLSVKDNYEVDMILLDLYLPGSRPDKNIRQLKEILPDIPVIIYTGEESDIWKRKMMSLGVHAYLTKDATKEEIMVVLNRVAKGEYIMSLKGPFKASLFQVLNQTVFTNNQMELLKLLCEVKNQKKIAKIKGTTVSNIEKTLKIMRRNAGVTSNLDLIKLCTEQGII